MPRFSESRIAANLQNMVARRREEAGLYKEIAEALPLVDAERLLDVGTGSGLQLRVIQRIKPDLELFGLDVSEASIRVARANLEGIEVDLRVGSIEDPPYEDDLFDVVTCNASMSYWQNPVSCFDQIYRILKPGGSAILFEPQKEIDLDQVVETIRTSLADKNWLRRWAAVGLNKYGLRWGRTLGLKLYSLEELQGMASRSRFGDRVAVERFTLQNLPIFVRIALIKPGQARG